MKRITTGSQAILRISLLAALFQSRLDNAQPIAGSGSVILIKQYHAVGGVRIVAQFETRPARGGGGLQDSREGSYLSSFLYCGMCFIVGVEAVTR